MLVNKGGFTLEFKSPSNGNIPAACGPYSHAVIAGDYVFLAGLDATAHRQGNRGRYRSPMRHCSANAPNQVGVEIVVQFVQIKEWGANACSSVRPSRCFYEPAIHGHPA